MKLLKYIITGLAACLPLVLSAYSEKNLLQQKAGYPEVRHSLLPASEWVPYPAYTDREGWEQLTGAYRSRLITAGEQLLTYEWKVVKATDYLEFERSGNRKIMEDPFNANMDALASLLLAELAEGEGRFTGQLINGAYYFCEMTSWVLSAHLNAQHLGRSLPDYTEQVIDLTSSDLGSLLAWTWYFMKDAFDQVNPVVNKRLHTELRKRILTPYMAEDRFWWMAFNLKPGGLVNN